MGLSFCRSVHRQLRNIAAGVSLREGYFLWSCVIFFGLGAFAFRVCRLGLYHFRHEELGTFLLGLCIITTPIFLCSFLRSRLSQFKLPVEILLILSFFFLILLFPSIHFVYLLAALNGVLLLYHAPLFFRGKRAFVFLPVISWAGFFIAVLVQGNYFLNFVSLESALLGIGYTDPMIDSAFSGVVRNFGHLSMGFDGFVPRTYHFFSHIWLGSAFQLLDLPPVYAYSLMVNIILFPLVFLSVFWVALTYTEDRVKLSIAAPVSALTICFGITTLLRYDWKSFVGVPTYTAALPPLLLAVAFLKNRDERVWISAGVSLLVMTILVLTKVSVGYAWMVLACCHILFFWEISKLKKMGLIGLHLAFAVVALKFVQPQEDAGGLHFEFLHFVKTFGYDYYLTKHFVTAIFFGLLYTFKSIVWRDQRVLSPKMVLAAYAVLVACMLPGLAINIIGGSAWYFSNIPAWIFIGLTAIELSASLAALWANYPMVFVPVALLLSLYVVRDMKPILSNELYNIVSTKADIVNKGAPGSINPHTISATNGHFFNKGLKLLLKSKVESFYTGGLFNLVKLRPFFSEHHGAPAFIPWDSKSYWKDGAWGYFKMVRLQALTGHIQILGVTEDSESEMRYFQSAHQICGTTSSKLYESIGQGAHFKALCARTKDSYIQDVIRTDRKEAENNDRELCRLALERGFQQVTKLSSDLSQATILDCQRQEILSRYEVGRGHL